MTDTTQDPKSSQYALMSLIGSVGASVAELSTIVAKGSEASAGHKEALDAIESTLADIASALEESGIADAIQRTAKALANLQQPKQAAPQVNVNVSPTPITFEAVIPAAPAPVIHLVKDEQKGQQWEVRIPGRMGGEARVMTIKRVA